MDYSNLKLENLTDEAIMVKGKIYDEKWIITSAYVNGGASILLTDKKTDFILAGESRTRKCGTTKDKQGVWLHRSRKHRYLYIIDNSLVVNYQEQSYPKGNDGNVKPSCCDGTNKVYDRRYEVWYTCPYCSGKCERIKE